MKAARCAPALCRGKPNDLAVGTASHRLNFLAARLNGTENYPKRPGTRRMSAHPANPGLEHGASAG
jgi:hypothetical protein